MFFIEGWVPVSEVTLEVFRKLQGLHVDGKIGKGHGSLKTVLGISVWEILDGATKIGATGPDGIVVDASRDLTAWADPTALMNEHINLQRGTVGSSRLPGEDGKVPEPTLQAQRYGAFYNLPVVIPVNSYQSSLGYLAEEVKDDASEDEGLREGARTILTMVQKGDLVTREIARARIGTGLTRRRFKMAWAIAAAKVPELRAPNRWTGL
ncbi:MAG: hypothetical protein AAF748_00725 [Pseudomonadota bacterium]